MLKAGLLAIREASALAEVSPELEAIAVLTWLDQVGIALNQSGWLENDPTTTHELYSSQALSLLAAAGLTD
ncbi:hypothetical protein AE923_08950 [Xanthomonas arboricola]|nr:hypothetical protein AE923_08950 [Xanthomonas arboricola]